jgi:hypothetical protein
MCEAGQKGIEVSKDLYLYIWQALTCGADIVDACARLPSSLQSKLGFSPTCTEQDWSILTSEECKDSMHCDKTKGGEVSDACFTCTWLFKTSPLFAGMCEPPGIKLCNAFHDKVAAATPIAGDLYLDDVPDPWNMPPWAVQGSPMRRRRRRLLARRGASRADPFTPDDQPGMGSPKLHPLAKSMSFPGNCFKLWRQVSVSQSAQEYIQQIDDPVKICKCMCQCPYTSVEYLGGLEQACNTVVDPEGYEFELEDTVGRECKEKKESDQAKFADEAAAGSEGEEGASGSKVAGAAGALKK